MVQLPYQQAVHTGIVIVALNNCPCWGNSYAA